MNCKEAQKLISLYVDNELNDTQKQLFMNHLKECEECSEELIIYKKMVETLNNSYNEEEVPSGFHSDLMDKINNKQRNAVSNSKRNLLRFVSIASGLVALFLVTIISVSILNDNRLRGHYDKSESDEMDTSFESEEYNLNLEDNNHTRGETESVDEYVMNENNKEQYVDEYNEGINNDYYGLVEESQASEVGPIENYDIIENIDSKEKTTSISIILAVLAVMIVIGVFVYWLRVRKIDD